MKVDSHEGVQCLDLLNRHQSHILSTGFSARPGLLGAVGTRGNPRESKKGGLREFPFPHRVLLAALHVYCPHLTYLDLQVSIFVASAVLSINPLDGISLSEHSRRRPYNKA